MNIKNTSLVVAGISAFALSSQAAVFRLNWDNATAGNGATEFNIGATLGEIATPLFTDFNNGTAQGDTWGGVGMPRNITVQNTRVTDFGGTDNNGAVFQSDTTQGGGINSVGGGDTTFTMDGSEGFQWTFSQGLTFEGLEFRGGNFSGTDTKELTIASPDWVGLTGVTTGTGVTYNSGAGSFAIANSAGGVGGDGILTAAELRGASGPLLGFISGVISFDNTGAQDYALHFLSFSTAAAPEPSTLGLVLIGGAALRNMRKNIKK